MQDLTIHQPTSIVSDFIPNVNLKWLQFFSIEKAMHDVINHLDTLPSYKTRERHTHKAYLAGIKKFIKFGYSLTGYPAMDKPPMIIPLPDENLLYQFIAHLRRRGLKSTTINNKYLAAIRLFIEKLYKQDINIEELSGADAMFVLRMKDVLRTAREIRQVKNDVSTNMPPLIANGNRLSTRQVNKVLRNIDLDTLTGLRDYALMYLAFNTGMRNAELQRLSLSNFSQEGDITIVRVQRKRNNYDPIPISGKVMEVIRVYVQAFNAHLQPDDPRYITPERGLWQPIGNDHKPASLNLVGYDPKRGLSTTSIWSIVVKRTEPILGFHVTVHDLRRTLAYLLNKLGLPRQTIQKILGHKSVGTTDNYIGDDVDLNDLVVSNYILFG